MSAFDPKRTLRPFNTKSATAIGVSFPPALFVTADEVID
jgi:hypothetical protein